jgi:hypothetical protein
LALNWALGTEFPAREEDPEDDDRSPTEPAADERARVIALLSPAPVDG